MLRFIGRRLLWMIPVILGISFILFAILEMMPGNPAQIILGDRADPAAVAALEEEMGLNDPFLTRYFRYVSDALHGDFGLSYRTRVPVFDEILARLPVTLILAIGGILLTVIIGIPIGILSAVKQYSLLDNVSMLLALIFNSMPGFWLGMILMLTFALGLGILPATGNVDGIRSYILPWIAVSAGMLAALIRMTRSSMLEVIRQDYINVARAKGANDKRVIWRHALRNALLPIVTIIGMDFASLLGGTLITEQLFALPGLGTLIINSVRSKDIPLVMASILFISLTSGIINLIVDVLYMYIDPRLKSQFVKGNR